MPQYYGSTRSYNLGSHTPGRAQGGTLEEPTAGNLHGGVREGRELTVPRLTYTRTQLETADRAKEDLKSRRFSSTRNRDFSPTTRKTHDLDGSISTSVYRMPSTEGLTMKATRTGILLWILYVSCGTFAYAVCGGTSVNAFGAKGDGA